MADLNPWLLAAIPLLLALVPCGYLVARKGLADGLAALQLAGIVTTMAALLLAAGFHRSSVADIPMALALLSFPSSLLFAHFLEALAMIGIASAVSIAWLAVGVGLVGVCVVGMLRAADAFGRLHFPGAAAVIGPPAIAAALTIAEGLSGTAIRGWLIAAFLLLTNGVLTHATARAEWLRRRSVSEREDEEGRQADARP